MIRRSAASFAVFLLLDPSFSELKNFAPTIIMAFLIIWCVVRLAPTWREVKLREMEIREKEIAQREQQAISIQSLADVTREIAIEQKNTTEALRIAGRVEIKRSDRLMDSVQDFSERLEAVEKAKVKEDGNS